MKTNARNLSEPAAGGRQAIRQLTPAAAPIHNSARALRMTDWAQRIDGSARMVAQRQQAQALVHPPLRPAVPAAAPLVVQRELDDDALENLMQFLSDRYEDPDNPPTWFQNAVFAYLGSQYDSYQQAIDAIEEAEYAASMQAQQEQGQATYASSSSASSTGNTGMPSSSSMMDDDAALAAMLDAYEQNTVNAAASSSSHVLHQGDEQKIDSNDTDTMAADDATLAPTYANFGQMAAALQSDKRKKYAAPKKMAITALIELATKYPDNPSPLLVADASDYVVRFQAAYNKGVEIAETHGLSNKTILEAAQVTILTEITQGLKRLAGMNWARPAGITATSYGTSSAADSSGTTHTLGQGGKTVTGRTGSRTGEAAFTMDASIALNNIYGLTFKNAFIAGHLVTRLAGGKAIDSNLAPFTGYFNQGGIRTPESTAEGLMRSDEVMSYSARATYGRTSANGSSVRFAQEDLNLIPTSVRVVVTRMGLAPGGNAENIVDWSVETETRFNDDVHLSLANVRAPAKDDSASSSSAALHY
ncbi:hypothetical protein [Massilia scottii]|uniref:hypothetical protein n=1 Tax=Massilia scottii TaxID=3057166 RepID=UPI0027968BA1|nr:hypothetical protein [Massilia sp. CCM 9029]MDQ1829276.1 hypothetical protein [Massilia sp. CCM 9029]